MRDNPTLSMIDDSDEEILYGSDTEQLLELVDAEHARLEQQQNNKTTSILIPNLMDTRTDEESD